MRSVKEIFVQNKNESSGEKLRSSRDWEWYYQISGNELNWESRLRVDFFITLEGLKSFFEGSLRVGMKNEIYQGNFHQEQEWQFWGEIEIE